MQRGTAYLGQGISWVDNRLEENFPGYSKTISDAVEPYIYLFTNTAKLFCIFVQNIKELVLENYPLVMQSVRKTDIFMETFFKQFYFSD